MSRWTAIRKAKEWLEKKPVYLDTETTGLGEDAEVVEIAIVDSDGSTLLNSLVKPKGEVPADAIKVHGISPMMLKNQPTWQEIWHKVRDVLANRLVLIYNAEYDIRLMRQSCALYGIEFEIPGMEVGDLLELYSEYKGVRGQDGQMRRWRLEQVGQELKIPIPNSHRALDDTLLARAVHLKIASEQLPWG